MSDLDSFLESRRAKAEGLTDAEAIDLLLTPIEKETGKKSAIQVFIDSLSAEELADWIKRLEKQDRRLEKKLRLTLSKDKAELIDNALDVIIRLNKDSISDSGQSKKARAAFDWENRLARKVRKELKEAVHDF